MRFYIAILLAVSQTNAFVPSSPHYTRQCLASRSIHEQPTLVFMSSTETTETTNVSTEQQQPMPDVELPPILEELRDVAMRLHTREQAPKEGQAPAPAKPAQPYVPTHADYLQFLVDSNAVYVVLEEIVNDNEKLAMFRNTGIERTEQLEKDIAYMCSK